MEHAKIKNISGLFVVINLLFIALTSKVFPLEVSVRYRLLLCQYLILAEALFILVTKLLYSNLVHKLPRNSCIGFVLRLFLLPVIVLAQSCMVLQCFLVGQEPSLLSVVVGYSFGFVMYLMASALVVEICFVVYFLLKNMKKRNMSGTSSIWKTYKTKKEEFVYIAIVFAMSLACFLMAYKHASNMPPVKYIDVKIRNLPHSFNNTRIVQLSDMHIGILKGKTAVENVVRTSNYLNPDIVAITGDTVEGMTRKISQSLEPLRNLTSKYGVYITTGNHDYYSADIDRWIGIWSSLGLKVLHNEKAKIMNKNNEFFYIAGIDDTEGKFFRGGDHGPDYEAALKDRDQRTATLLLSHRPSVSKTAIAKYGNIQLALSGHTHGGQFPFTGLYHFLSEAYFYGLNRYDKDSYVYVSTGIFYWAAPLRFIAEGEIPCITLIST
eukprot:gene7355-8173_t